MNVIRSANSSGESRLTAVLISVRLIFAILIPEVACCNAAETFARWIPVKMSILAGSLRVMFRAKKGQRHIWLLASDRTVWAGADVGYLFAARLVVECVC